MLSICIPVYNFRITSLLHALLKQMEALPVPCEVICIDDASANEYRATNRVVKGIRYIQLPENIGRARIRNLFLEYASFDYSLFLDCDSLIISDSFLADYIKYINCNGDFAVVCGGRVYPASLPGKQYKLRWLYGIKRESQPVSKRRQHPNNAFMTNNFVIRKQIFLQNQFDERLTGYGHEDTLFGYALQKKGIAIHHVDNPVLNGHIETNREYLLKTKQAVSNLAGIATYMNQDEAFANSISLLRFYNRLGKSKAIIRIGFALLCPFMEWMLLNGAISLHLFDAYKLGLFVRRMHQLDKQS